MGIPLESLFTLYAFLLFSYWPFLSLLFFSFFSFSLFVSFLTRKAFFKGEQISFCFINQEGTKPQQKENFHWTKIFIHKKMFRFMDVISASTLFIKQGVMDVSSTFISTISKNIVGVMDARSTSISTISKNITGGL